MVNNQLINKNEENGNKMTFSSYMTSNAVSAKINQIIGNDKDGAKFISTIISSVQANPMLKECTNSSILSCALTAHALNLSPSPQLGQIYLVPFKVTDKETKKQRTEAQLQIGTRAYIQLAIRSGYYTKINVVPIKKGELVKFDPLMEDIEVNLIENEIEREHAETIGYYGMFEYKNGFKKAIYWSKEKMILHADRYSKSFNASDYKLIQEGKIAQKDMWKYSSPWYTSFDAMAEKTLIKHLLSKWGILSTELQEALEKDQSVINEDGSVTYVDNIENEEFDYAEENNNEDKVQTESVEHAEVISIDDIK